MTFYDQNDYPLVDTPVTISFLDYPQEEWFSKIKKINPDQIVVFEPNQVTEFSPESGMELTLTWPDPEGLGQVKCILETIYFSSEATYWKLNPISVFEINQRRAYSRIEVDFKINIEIENNSISAKLINLSYEGMQCELLWVPDLLDIGNKVRTIFIYDSQEIVAISGEVVRIKLLRQHKASVAIFFDKSNESDNHNFTNYFFCLENMKQDPLHKIISQ